MCILQAGWVDPRNCIQPGYQLCENWGRVSAPSGEYYTKKLPDWTNRIWTVSVFSSHCLSLCTFSSGFLSQSSNTQTPERGRVGERQGRVRECESVRGWEGLCGRGSLWIQKSSGATTLTGLKQLTGKQGNKNIQPFKDNQGSLATLQGCCKLWLKPHGLTFASLWLIFQCELF